MRADKEAIDGVKMLLSGLHAAMTQHITNKDHRETEVILRQLDERFGKWLCDVRRID
ncbi:hypothetical protein LO749_00935 [Paracoccus denitrificans]|uniref:hypothetical protein n=1 Tax=Paracoccus denitrificans TaxID=266 RepID=UPI001E5004A8|nr:hypothetical protein [Paracoccus denitrificans]UFS65166.1 hypothetical protein LO749_00935 [Paracoccus denitrificans]